MNSGNEADSSVQSIDLHSVAHAHLCSALLRIQAVADSPRLPDEVKHGVPKPDISEEERAALHNVTSGLFNQPKVRATLDAAVADICQVLHVQVPDKKGKLKRGDKKNELKTSKDTEEEPTEKGVENSTKEKKTKGEEKPAKSENRPADQPSDDEDSEWGGLSDDDEGDEDEELIEKALAQLEDRVGGSDSDENTKSDDEDEYDTANEELDPMEITDESASEDSEDSDDSDDSEGDEAGMQSGLDEDGSSDSEEGSASESESESESESGSDSELSAISPPPKASRKDSRKEDEILMRGGMLPSLMGGYISGSESEASDIDVAPAARKNRRGQRARQAIWEKKFKEKAKHLGQDKSGRDSGWDLKRGAVDGNERTPWKKGIKTPFERRSDGQQEYGASEPSRPRPPTKKDDEGPLHPSWEARKKAKEAEQTAAFQGKKITFD